MKTSSKKDKGKTKQVLRCSCCFGVLEGFVIGDPSTSKHRCSARLRAQ